MLLSAARSECRSIAFAPPKSFELDVAKTLPGGAIDHSQKTNPYQRASVALSITIKSWNSENLL